MTTLVRQAPSGTSTTLYNVALMVAWASSYAQKPLDRSHHMWPLYWAYSEWFRHRISDNLGRPLDAKWEEIYRRVGCLIESEYPSQEEFRAASDFGHRHYLDDELADAMVQRFEIIKYQIVGRV